MERNITTVDGLSSSRSSAIKVPSLAYRYNIIYGRFTSQANFTRIEILFSHLRFLRGI